MQKQLTERWFAYILQCADGSLYTGITNDLERRVEQNNAGTASRDTRSTLPVTLAYQEEVRTKGAASKRKVANKALSQDAKQKLGHGLLDFLFQLADGLLVHNRQLLYHHWFRDGGRSCHQSIRQ